MPVNWRTLAWLLPACAGMGAIPGLIEVVFRGMPLRAFALSALAGFVYAACIAGPCALLIPKVCCSLPASPFGIRWAAGGGLLLVVAVFGCLAANVILAGMGLVRWRTFGPTFWWSLRICLLITFSFGVLGTVIATLQSRLVSVREELQRRQIAEERERKIAAEARFASLESRVHPHFLFNTLNSISALVRENPAEAERTIDRLAALLRFSLDSELAGVVALREELTIVRDYLEIEKVRFGARLRYRIEAADTAGERMVPALSIQTLVENSVKHAVGSRREGAEIVVSATLEGGTLRVEVADDGPGFDPLSSPRPGHGMDLLERRLESLFGSAASLETIVADGLTRVAISIRA